MFFPTIFRTFAKKIRMIKMIKRAIIMSLLLCLCAEISAQYHIRQVVPVEQPSDVHRQTYEYKCKKCGNTAYDNSMFYSNNMEVWYKYRTINGVYVLQPVNDLPKKCGECKSTDDDIVFIIVVMLISAFILVLICPKMFGT